MNRLMATGAAMLLIFRFWVRKCDHRVRSGVGNAWDGVTVHGMAWLSTKWDQAMGVLHPSLVPAPGMPPIHLGHEGSPGHPPLENKHAFAAAAMPPTSIRVVGASVCVACLGPGFKYPGPGGGHGRNQTPPRPAAMDEAKIRYFLTLPI